MKSPIYITSLVLLSFLWQSCTNDTEHRSAPNEMATLSSEEEQAEENEEYVRLTKAQAEKIGLSVGKMELKDLTGSVPIRGKLDVPSKNEAKVSAIIPAIVAEIYPEPGIYVRKGQKLAMLQDLQIVDLQEEYLRLKAELGMREKEVERQKALQTEKINATKTLEQEEAKLAQTMASLKSLSLKLSLLGINTEKLNAGNIQSGIYVRSPINGYLNSIHLNIGEKVMPEKVLFRIVNTGHIRADLLVYEKDIDKIKLDQKITVFLQSAPTVFYNAYVFAIGKRMDEEQRAILVHAEIDNDDGKLVPGMYVEGRIETSQEKGLTIPEKAVVSARNLDFIFWQQEEQEDEIVFKRVPVIRELADAGYVEISPMENLPEDANIVVEGSFYLLAESLKNSGGGEDDH